MHPTIQILQKRSLLIVALVLITALVAACPSGNEPAAPPVPTAVAADQAATATPAPNPGRSASRLYAAP